jgi:hypothetical protein
VPVKLETFDRPEWLTRRWDYQDGQHVSIYGPNGVGKTRTLFELLKHTPGVSPRTLVMKPRDVEPAKWTRALGYQETGHWPPPRKLFEGKPPGYTLWPRQSLTDHAADEALLYREFAACLQDSYKRGDCIVAADEIAGLCDIPTPKGKVPLARHCSAIWMRGRAMGCGMWAATQRPFGDAGTTGIPQHMHSEASHWIIGRDPDPRNRGRVGQISGADPAVVAEAVAGLRLHPIEAPDGTVNYVSELLHAMKGGPNGAYLCKVMPW